MKENRYFLNLRLLSVFKLPSIIKGYHATPQLSRKSLETRQLPIIIGLLYFEYFSLLNLTDFLPGLGNGGLLFGGGEVVELATRVGQAVGALVLEKMPRLERLKGIS